MVSVSRSNIKICLRYRRAAPSPSLAKHCPSTSLGQKNLKIKLPPAATTTDCDRWDRSNSSKKILRCHPAWRVICAHLACTTMHRHLVTACRSVSHTPGGETRALFPIALESPFSGILFCCNFTICSSLGERCSRLLTLSQRFSAFYHAFFPLSRGNTQKIFLPAYPVHE